MLLDTSYTFLHRLDKLAKYFYKWDHKLNMIVWVYISAYSSTVCRLDNPSLIFKTLMLPQSVRTATIPLNIYVCIVFPFS